MIESALADVRTSHDDIDVKESHGQDGAGDRDRAIMAASQAGADVAAISESCGLTREQVLSIIDDHENLPEAQF